MLKRVEIKNFESHVHTVVDFEDGFNLIVGPSNSGKSSILRAIALCAYNEWDQRSLRTSAKTAEVTLTTDKGVVKVRRGKETNDWEVTPDGKETKKFSRIGKGVLPEAAEVIGLKTVKLGPQEVRPNVMNQLEGHFMMSEVEGEPASGSTRACIIDEISGLAGMEELIRDVNLDNVRNARSARQAEEDAKATLASMHDQTAIDAEVARLASAEKHLELANASADSATEVEDLSDRCVAAALGVSGTSASLAGIPDVAKAEKNLKASQASQEAAVAVERCDAGYQAAKTAVSEVKAELDAIPDDNAADKALSKAKAALELALGAEASNASVDAATGSVRGLEADVEEADRKLAVEGEALRTMVAEVEICPICLGPRHEGCGECSQP